MDIMMLYERTVNVAYKDISFLSLSNIILVAPACVCVLARVLDLFKCSQDAEPEKMQL